MRTWTAPSRILSNFHLPQVHPRRITTITHSCDMGVNNQATNGIYEPFFELYVRAVCMKPVHGQPGVFECVDSIPMPPMEAQMEIVDAIQLYQLVLDIDPIQGLLVRLMLMENASGIQAALEALTDHYAAIERLQQLSEQIP